MPAKRRMAKHRDYPMTPEAVAAFRSGDEAELRRLWELRPWQVSPIEAVGDCPWPSGVAADWWPTAAELREELEAASCR